MLPSSGITTTLVGNALGSSSRSLSVLCRSSAINKYSRHKPYRIPQNTSIYGSTGTDDTQIKGYNFGMSPVTMPIGYIRDQGSSPSLVWGQWSVPSGGSATPYRLGDFRGYDHTNKASHIKTIKLYNSAKATSTKPVVVKDNEISSVDVGYYGEIKFNSDASIHLNEFWADNWKLKDLYLTLIIGANMGGLSTSEAVFAQSSNTLEQFITTDPSGTWRVYMKTSVLGFKNMLDTNGGKNIVFLCLAPKWASIGQTNIITLHPWGNESATLIYNSKYAQYGDGGEGGDKPVSTIYGHLIAGGSNNKPSVYLMDRPSEHRIDIMVNSYPSVSVTSGALPASNSVIISLAIQYEIYDSGGSFVTSGTRTFTEEQSVNKTGDCVTFVNPNAGQDFFGISLSMGSLPSGSGTIDIRYVMNQRQSNQSSTATAVLASDGQLDGLSSSWISESFYIN